MEGKTLKIEDLKVLHEDNHFIAIHKKAGWLVQGDETGDATAADLVKLYIKIRYDKPGDVFLGIAHRLDRPVSGALIFARTSKGLTRINELFRERKIQKTYLAITKERPDQEKGQLIHYLIKDREKNKVKVYDDQSSNRSKEAKRAITNYEILGVVDNRCLLKVEPVTGRPHQIRAQLARIGCPIVGDLKYGYPQPNRDGSIHLHCHKMSFIHPVKKEPVEIMSAVPKENLWPNFKQIIR